MCCAFQTFAGFYAASHHVCLLCCGWVWHYRGALCIACWPVSTSLQTAPLPYNAVSTFWQVKADMLQGSVEAGFAKIEQENPWLSTTPLVVKPDQLIKRRGKAGLLAVNKTWPEVQAWVSERMGKSQQVYSIAVHLRIVCLLHAFWFATRSASPQRQKLRSVRAVLLAVLGGTVLRYIPQLFARHSTVTKTGSQCFAALYDINSCDLCSENCAPQYGVGAVPAAVASGCIMIEPPSKCLRLAPVR